VKSTHAKLIEALTRVEDFLEENRPVMESAITPVAHQQFSASRAAMEQHMTLQDSWSRGRRHMVAAKRTLRERLIRKHMRPIGVVARTQLAQIEDLAALVPPRRNKQFTGLVAAGYGMAEAARRHEATFLAAGLPTDFLEKLVRATDALKDAISLGGQNLARQTRATAGLTKAGRTARDTLRVLDSLVRAAVEKDDVLLDQWTTISRVVAVATTPEDTSELPEPGPTPGPIPAPVPVPPVASPASTPAPIAA
jgi:hypothetical protein